MKFVSLFAGIGGLDLGLERAGWECVAQIEIEPFARRVLAKHWPAVPRWADVREVRASDLPACDAIVGGFPCQDISCAGRGDGLSGERSGLWFEFLRLVQEVRPAWVLAENVPALRTRGIDTVLSGLEQEGYACWPVVVGARHVGAPHRRDRVFIVARLDHSSSEGRGAARHAVDAATPGAGALIDSAGSSRGLADADQSVRRRWADKSIWTEEQRAIAGGNGVARLADADDGRGWQDRQSGELRPGGVVEPPGHRRDTAARSSHQEPQRRVSMDDAASAGREAGHVSAVEQGPRPVVIGSGPGTMADADRAGLLAERSGGLLDGERAAFGYDAHRRNSWPSRPGEPQHEWEEPRVVNAASERHDVGWRRKRPQGETLESARTTEPPLGGAVDGLPAGLVRRESRLRRASLKAYGNAVVPQVAEVIGRAIGALA